MTRCLQIRGVITIERDLGLSALCPNPTYKRVRLSQPSIPTGNKSVSDNSASRELRPMPMFRQDGGWPCSTQAWITNWDKLAKPQTHRIRLTVPYQIRQTLQRQLTLWQVAALLKRKANEEVPLTCVLSNSQQGRFHWLHREVCFHKNLWGNDHISAFTSVNIFTMSLSLLQYSMYTCSFS